MENQIRTLVKLQEIDAQIYALKRESELKPAEMRKLRDEFSQNEQAAKKIEEEVKLLQVERKNKELDLEAKEANVKKLQIQLYQVKTNKEYSSLKSEIEGLKADNSLLEEEILLFFDKIDQLKDKVEKERSSLEEARGRLKEEEERVGREIKDIETKIDVLKKERESLVGSVKKELLARYEKILANKNGLAIVPVKDDACQGCHISLPPQVINEISMNEWVITCESCTRILYIPGQ